MTLPGDPYSDVNDNAPPPYAHMFEYFIFS